MADETKIIADDVTDVKLDDLTDDFTLDDSLDVRIEKIHVKNLLNALDTILQGRKLTKGNMIRVAAALMNFSKQNNLPNKLKKQALMQALNIFLKKDKDLTEEDRELMLILVSEVVDNAIDVLYDNAKLAGEKIRSWCCCVKAQSEESIKPIV
jgi:hypothetical protein